MMTVSADAKQRPQQLAHELSADEIVAKLKGQLELTDKQVQEVKPIIENFIVQEDLLKQEEKKQLSKVLTSGQLYSWMDLQKQAERDKKKHGKP